MLFQHTNLNMIDENEPILVGEDLIGNYDGNNVIQDIPVYNSQLKMPSMKDTVVPEASRWSSIRQQIPQLIKTDESQYLDNQRRIRNTSYYRTYQRNKSIMTENLFSNDFEYLINPNFYTDINQISSPTSSASGSSVYLLKDKNNYSYVLKITVINNNELEIINEPTLNSSVQTESKFYKLMSVLVKKNVTPHVFQYGSESDLFLFENISETLRSDFKKYITKQKMRRSKKRYSHVKALLVETKHENVNMDALYDFMIILQNSPVNSKTRNYIIFHILFQLIYTLHVFNLLKIKHNDLHSGNIFIIKRTNNILDNNIQPFNRKYVYNYKDKIHEFNLPNIGLDVRIYDFDRTVKQKTPGSFYPNEIIPYLGGLVKINVNDLENPSFDTFKLIGTLYHKLYNKFNDVKKFIESIFGKKSILKKCDYDLEYADLSLDLKNQKINVKRRYYLLARPLTDSEMNPTETILNKLHKKLQSLNKNVVTVPEVTEIYSTQFLDESYISVISKLPSRLPLKSKRRSKVKSMIKSKRGNNFKQIYMSNNYKSLTPKKSKKKIFSKLFSRRKKI